MFIFLIKEDIICNNTIYLFYKNNLIRKLDILIHILLYHFINFHNIYKTLKKKKLKNKKSVSFQ